MGLGDSQWLRTGELRWVGLGNSQWQKAGAKVGGAG